MSEHTKSRPRKERTTQVAYKLPDSLVRRIRVEAARLGKYPAHVVAERLLRSYDQPPKPAA